MPRLSDLRVPDLGDFRDVPVIEVHVRPGDRISREQPLITLESDKATMEVPATAAGRVVAVAVKVGDRVSAGTVILQLEEVSDQAAAADATPASAARGQAASVTAAGMAAGEYSGKVDVETSLLVLGAGPGGYTAAFRAADLGLEVTLVERWATLGGVCLNVGCIPSKALLHAARVIEEAQSMSECGVHFGRPEIDIPRLRGWKNKVVGRLTGGLAMLAKQRNVRVVQGTGQFLSPHHLEVLNGDARQVIHFRQCIIAAGSESARIAGLPQDPRILDSTGALELNLPESLLVIGGGIIGLEMATVYDALGVPVSVVELLEQLMPGCDPDLLRPLERRIRKRYQAIRTGTKVIEINTSSDLLEVFFETEGAVRTGHFGAVLVAVGRSPNSRAIAAEKAGIRTDDRGFIRVDRQMRTNVAHIFAIGDIAGPPMLAHKASHEGKVAAEVAAGRKRAFDARVIPAVAYTDPEIAWVGVTENQAKADGIAHGKGVFPWAASGRSLALNRDDGLTKIIFDTTTHRVIGAGIVGPNAGELIGELALAIEMGCEAEDIGLTIHPHPTLSETIAFAAEAYEGTLTDLYLPKKGG